MENGAFSAGPADGPGSNAAQTPRQPPPPSVEMTTKHRTEEKLPLCQCEVQCSCVELGKMQAERRKTDVRVESWSRNKSVLMAMIVVALVIWCGVMAVMFQYGLL